jgi:hypothetical protein
MEVFVKGELNGICGHRRMEIIVRYRQVYDDFHNLKSSPNIIAIVTVQGVR